LSSSYNGQPYEALFIDIELPGISGMDVAKTVRENGYAGMIVLLPAMSSLCMRGTKWKLSVFVKAGEGE
jgi:DNA-binding response OmpR family regulator